MITLHHGECLAVLRTLDAASVDAVVTDPPAGIAFMGKEWDHAKGGRDAWIGWLAERLAECLRVAKPGAVLLCWAIPRTSHWTGMAIEDAGWCIEDRIAHHFGSGFPKHKSKLKPATEDWWLARKPGPKWLNVDGCRVPAPEGLTSGGHPNGSSPLPMNRVAGLQESRDRTEEHPAGRWPANLVLSHSPACNGVCAADCPVRLMGEQSGERSSRPGRNPRGVREIYGGGWKPTSPRDYVDVADTGTAARFFPQFTHDPFLYAAKASRAERNRGCEGMEERPGVMSNQAKAELKRGNYDVLYQSKLGTTAPCISPPQANHHPTVKPLTLMRWLCRLACPPNGTILDPFAGSGSTGCAALEEGFSFVGIEQDAEYEEIGYRRADAMRLPLFDEPVARVGAEA